MSESFRKTVLKNCNLPHDTVVFVDLDRFEISKVTRGIVVVYAVWSGPSHVAWRLLTSTLVDHRAPQFTVYVVDADEISQEFIELLLPVGSHGYGEAFWVRDGQIVQKWSGKNGRIEDIARFTEEAFRE